LYNSSIMLRSHDKGFVRSHVLCVAILLSLGACFMPNVSFSSSAIVEVTELLAHPDHYDHQVVTVSGRVTSFQLATNRDGHPAFGFLLQDTAGTVKVIGLGKADVREGDYVVVEGIFSRLRQAGRAIVYNEIKATSVQSMTRMNPDLVG
jgi:OB-fold nucleic acid binding domain.